MTRIAEYPISSLFLERWSPRAMSGEAMSPSEMSSLFEAARWAPSSSNVQPWRFCYALRDTPFFSQVHGALVEGNRAWCVRAGALIVVMSNKVLDNGKPSHSHAFDTGAAWMNLALQGSLHHLVVHAMLGFDEAAVRSVVQAPDHFDVQCVIAVGKPGKIDDLPEHLRARETPSSRRSQSEWKVEGPWPRDRPPAT